MRVLLEKRVRIGILKLNDDQSVQMHTDMRIKFR